jgi:neutral ceramidase
MTIRDRKARALILSIIFSGSLILGFAQGERPLRVGRAAVKITPAIGSPMGSSYGVTVSKGVQDDIFAKAIVIEQDGRKVGMVACDLISLRPAIVEEARRLIQSTTSLRPEDVIISATHCHAGPQMHPLFLKQVGGEAEQLGLEYIKKLPSLIAESVQRAEADLTTARMSAAIGCEESLVFNRRFLMSDGSVRMNPGRRNPNAVRPVAGTDCTLSVVYFESLDSRPLVTLVNYPLHVAVAGGDHFSSDYPGVLSRILAKVKGESMLTLFTNGTSGNINHVDVERELQPRGKQEVARIGVILSSAVLKLFDKLEPIETFPVKAASRKVELAVPEITPQQLEQAREVMSRYGKPSPPAFDEVVRAWRAIDLAELKGRPLTTEVQAIAFGNTLAVVGFPGDAFMEMGQGIKTNSPFPLTIVSEQSGSGAISYVPNRRAFPERGYEVVSTRFLPGGGEALIDAAVGLLIELFPYQKGQASGTN